MILIDYKRNMKHVLADGSDMCDIAYDMKVKGYIMTGRG